LSYEHKFTHRFGLEGGLYLKAYELLDPAVLNVPYHYEVSKVNRGAYFMVYPKLYRYGRGINYGSYFGLRTGYKTFNAVIVGDHVRNQSVSCSEIPFILTVGSHQQIASRFTLGLEMGFGARKFTYRKLAMYDDINMVQLAQTRDLKVIAPAFIVDLSFGVLF